MSMATVKLAAFPQGKRQAKPCGCILKFKAVDFRFYAFMAIPEAVGP